jgi:zinc protease
MNCFRTAHRAVWAVALVAVLAPPSALSAAEPKKVVSLEGITEYELDNGLRVLLYPDASASRVTVNLTVLVGSRHEGYGETGMAHLLEHMLFKGTPRHPDVPKVLRDHGASFNGTTWVDRTNYFETMPASEENLAFAIGLEADRLVNSNVKREDLASEMTVVRNEFEIGENSPFRMLMQRMLAVAYEWHNYGKSTIGNRSDIERVPIESLQAFYRKHYQPDNAVLIVSGNFDEKKALALIGEQFGALKRPSRKLDKTYTDEPPQDGERSVTLRRVGKAGYVGAVYHVPAASHEDFAAVEVLANMITAEPSGRLYQALVPTKKAAFVAAQAMGYHDPGVLMVLAQTDSEKELADVRDTMTDVLEKLGTDKLTDKEINRAKAKLLKQREQLTKDVNRIGIELSEWVGRGDWRLFLLHRDRLAKVTPEDVRRAAAKYLLRSNRTVGLFVPTGAAEIARAAVPETPDLATLLQQYKGGEAVAEGEKLDPTPENIEKRARRSELPGGVKLALLPKKSRGEAVTLQMVLRFGNPDSLRGRVKAAEFLGRLMARGTRAHNYQELEDELDIDRINLSVGSSPGELTVTLQCKRSTLPKALALVREVLREPTLPEDQFEILKRQSIAGLRQNSTEPQALAPRALRRKLNPYPADDVRYAPTIDEELAELEKLSVEDVRKLYREQLGAVAGEAAVVGDFDPETTAKALGDVLKDWKTDTAYRRIERPAHVDVKGEKVVIDTPDKANATYYAGFGLAMTDADPDYPSLAVADYILGGAPLASRLSNRIRGREGLSYSVGSGYSASSLDKSARLTLVATCKPDKMAKVEQAMAEELAKFVKEGVTAKELDEAKKAYLEAEKNGRSTDAALAAELRDELEAGRTTAYLADFEKKVAALTPEQVNAAVRKHIEPTRLVIVEAGDFKQK